MNYFNPAEGAIIAEIYLPKRSYLQGALYQCLTSGFRATYVREFLLRNADRVKEVLSESTYVQDFDSVVEGFRDVFSGYSLYEVDGVFKGREMDAVIEERTQVIRVIFRPQVVVLAPEVPFEKSRRIVNEYLLRLCHRTEFVADFSKREGIPEAEMALVRDLYRWEGEVALFLFGFLVVSITLPLRALGDAKAEEEIWVTSEWGNRVNRITRERVGHASGAIGPAEEWHRELQAGLLKVAT